MRVTPQTEEQIESAQAAFRPFPRGTYDFEVFTAEEQTSNAGNEMIKMELTIFNESGEKRKVFDYLLDSMPAKLRHAAAACGLLAKYEHGILTADDFIGRTGHVKIRHVPAKGAYKEKNEVDDYVVPNVPQRAFGAQARQPVAASGDDLNDDIPF